MSDDRGPIINKGGLVRRGEMARLQSSKGLLSLARITDLLATPYRLFYSDVDGDIIELAHGTSGQVLTSNGASAAPSWATASGAMKTSGAGYFMIPAGPAVGTTLTSSASANTYGSYVQMIASTSAALYIVGVTIDRPSNDVLIDIIQMMIGTGPATETPVGEWKWAYKIDTSGASVPPMFASFIFPFPIPVATGTRIALKVADDVASALTYNATLICIDQSNLVAL